MSRKNTTTRTKQATSETVCQPLDANVLVALVDAYLPELVDRWRMAVDEIQVLEQAPKKKPLDVRQLRETIAVLEQEVRDVLPAIVARDEYARAWSLPEIRFESWAPEGFLAATVPGRQRLDALRAKAAMDGWNERLEARKSRGES